MNQDLDLVKKCRSDSYKTNQELKKADCSKDMATDSDHIRKCIVMEMKKRNPNFVFDDDSIDAEISTKEFFDCMDKVF